MKMRMWRMYVIGFILALSLGTYGQEITNTWVGTVSRDWFTDGNWSEGTPVAGQHVRITNAIGNRALLSGDTPWLASLIVTNSSLTFTNWSTTLYATNVTLFNNGVFNLPGAFTTNQMSNAVRVVCTDFVLTRNAQIVADIAGYAGVAASSGQGAGGGVYGSSSSSGGGYGGQGGESDQKMASGIEYGLANAPAEPGSSGGSTYANRVSGAGGGYVSILATNVILDGTISANGGSAGQYAGGGSGGGVRIVCATLAGSGTVYAKGGNGGTGNSGGGGGGGGRVAFDCPAIFGHVRADTTPGNNGAGVSGWLPASTSPFQLLASAGTFYAPSTNGWLTETLTNSHVNVRLVVPGFTSWAPANLTVANTKIRFADDFSLNVASNLTIGPAGALILLGNPQLGCGSNLTVNAGELHANVFRPITCGGDFVVTNTGSTGGKVYLYSGPTNELNPKYGGLVSVTGDLVVATNCWIYPQSDATNGGSIKFAMQNFSVLTPNSGFDADKRGFRARFNPAGDGYGPGGAPVATGHRGGGGGYGGKGGWGYYNGVWYGPGGTNYGRIEAPLEPGSAGGGRVNNSEGGNGGGLIWIDATGKAVLNGTLRANGESRGYYSGAGSGGGIFVACDSFEGGSGAWLRAEGGDNPDNTQGNGGGGGGGRVAIAIRLSASDREKLENGETVARFQMNTTHAMYSGSIGVMNGQSQLGNGDTTKYPEPGTAVFITTAYLLNISGDPDDYGHPGPAVYGNHTRYVDNECVTNAVISPDDEAAGARHACIGWALTGADGTPMANDTTTNAVFNMTTNLNLTWRWTNEYQLAVSTAHGGEATMALNGWYTNGTVVSGITATPAAGYSFVCWVGGVPAGYEEDNPLTVIMDRPRMIGAVFGTASGQIKTWTGTNIWENSANWSPSGMPAPNDTVTIKSGQVILWSPRTVASLNVSNNAVLLFTNWTAKLTATHDITVFSNGTITCAGPFTDSEMSNRVHLVTDNLTVQKTGKIIADGCGYAAVTNYDGYGSGKGLASGSGGGHGGVGGDKSSLVFGGAVCGSLDAPEIPGSSGGGSGTSFGGAGGGVIRLNATNLVVDGTVSANGANAPGNGGGGGAGGSVYVVCQDFGGAGSITAKGGNGYNGGGGGGGRIAVSYETMQDGNAVSYWTAPGNSIVDGYFRGLTPSFFRPPEMGTLWLSGTNGWLAPVWSNRFQSVQLRAPNFTDWAPDSFTLANCKVKLPPDFALSVTGNLAIHANADLLVSGDPGLTCGGDVLLNGGQLVILGSTQFACAGSVSLTNAAKFHVQSAATNGVSAFGTEVRIGGLLEVTANCWIYPYSESTNGGSCRFGVGNLFVSTAGGIDANQRGFMGGYARDGYGPGAGIKGNNRGGGGGYGGQGGDGYWRGWNGFGGPAYGSSNNPVHAGSGGGGDGSSHPGGTSGGGLIWVTVADRLQLEGTLTACGGAGYFDCGSGAGGGINVIANRFFGGVSGRFLADGGNAYGAETGPGGGGRIAVTYRKWAFEGTFSVSNGSSGPNYAAEPERAPAVGTLVLHELPPRGSMLIVR